MAVALVVEGVLSFLHLEFIVVPEREDDGLEAGFPDGDVNGAPAVVVLEVRVCADPEEEVRDFFGVLGVLAVDRHEVVEGGIAVLVPLVWVTAALENIVNLEILELDHGDIEAAPVDSAAEVDVGAEGNEHARSEILFVGDAEAEGRVVFAVDEVDLGEIFAEDAGERSEVLVLRGEVRERIELLVPEGEVVLAVGGEVADKVEEVDGGVAVRLETVGGLVRVEDDAVRAREFRVLLLAELREALDGFWGFLLLVHGWLDVLEPVEGEVLESAEVSDLEGEEAEFVVADDERDELLEVGDVEVADIGDPVETHVEVLEVRLEGESLREVRDEVIAEAEDLEVEAVEEDLRDFLDEVGVHLEDLEVAEPEDFLRDLAELVIAEVEVFEVFVAEGVDFRELGEALPVSVVGYFFDAAESELARRDALGEPG